MPLPPAIGTCTITGKFAIPPDGAVDNGRVVFIGPELFDTTDHVVLASGAYVGELDGTGAFSVAVPYNDNPGVTPTGWSYQVIKAVAGGQETFYTQVTRSSGATVQYDALAQAPIPSGPIFPSPWVPLAAILAKGDMLSGSDVATVTRTAAGVNGQAWVADSAAAGGVAWHDMAGPVLNLRSYGAVGNGVTDDSAAVQSWLTALAAAGGVGWVPAGTYLTSTTPSLTGATGFQIRGTGRASVFKAAAASQPNLLQFTNCTHFSIADIAMDGNKANVTQLATQYATLSGIWMTGCDDVTISGCHIHDVYVSGIMANGGCSNLTITDCRLTGCGDNQIYIRASNLTPYTPCTDVTVTGCTVSGGAFSGIQGLGSTSLKFNDNTCYSNGPTAGQGDGIGVEGCSSVVIDGNICHDNGVQGIQTRFTNEVGASRQSSHVTITGNVVYNHTSTSGDAGGIGINDTDDVTVTGNVVYGNHFGINVNGGSGLGVSHLGLGPNTVRSNTDSGVRVTPGAGSDYTLQGCVVTDNGADQLYASVPVIVQGGQYCRAPAGHEGIHLASGSSNSRIEGAIVAGNADNGILIDSPVSGVIIRGGTFDGSGTDQLRAVQEQAGAGPTTIIGSTILNQKLNPYVFNNAASRYYPIVTGGFTNADQGAIFTTYDAGLVGSSGATITSGVVYLARVRIAYPTTVTNLSCMVGTAGSGVTGAYFGLYDSTGTLVASTADRHLDAAWTGGSQPETAPLSTPYAAAAGLYWVALLLTFTGTSPSIGRQSVINASTVNVFLSAAAGNLRYASFGTGQSVLPGSITPTAMAGDNHAFWFGGN